MSNVAAEEKALFSINILGKTATDVTMIVPYMCIWA